MCTKVIQEQNVGDAIGRAFSGCEIYRTLSLLLCKVIHHVGFHNTTTAIVDVITVDAIVMLLVRHAGGSKGCSLS